MADYLVPFSAFAGILKLGFASRGLGPLAGLCCAYSLFTWACPLFMRCLDLQMIHFAMDFHFSWVLIVN